jgi:hypothetical protein
MVLTDLTNKEFKRNKFVWVLEAEISSSKLYPLCILALISRYFNPELLMIIKTGRNNFVIGTILF